MAEHWLAAEGAVHLADLIAPDLSSWDALTCRYFERRKPGVRIVGDAALDEAIGRLLKKDVLRRKLAGGAWRCVRAIAFDKAPDANWTLAWHQDRTIAVKEKIDVAGFGPWSVKDHITHVEPPFELMARMRTLRLHFDDTDDTNGALLVASGSHRLGRVADKAAAGEAASRPILTCTAAAGDGWLYATPVLHASARSTKAARRRVLQLDLSQHELPAPLEWRGIA